VVTDITEHPSREDKVYCAVVLDAFCRRVVGWSIDGNPTAALVTNTLGIAIEQGRPPDRATVIHGDQGTQFTSSTFTQRSVDSGLLPSMGSVGDCYDNAMIESYWSRAHENRPPRSSAMEDSGRAGERDLRVFGDLP